MITAKEALRMAKPAEIEAQEALIEIEKIIKENAEKGSTSVIIRKAPYRYYVAVAQRPKFKQNYTKMPLFR